MGGIWSLACQTYGWGTGCTGFYQAFPVGIGGELRNLYVTLDDCVLGDNHPASAAFDCMPVWDEAECNATVSSIGVGCSWCAHKKEWVEQFGVGSCMLTPLAKAGCSIVGDAVFGPMNETGLLIPNATEQALCLVHNDSKESCEGELHGGQECSYCDMPDVYGWRPYTAMCMHKHLMIGGGWCKMLTDVPEKARDILQVKPCPNDPNTTTTENPSVSGSSTSFSSTTTTKTRYSSSHTGSAVIKSLLVSYIALFLIINY